VPDALLLKKRRVLVVCREGFRRDEVADVEDEPQAEDGDDIPAPIPEPPGTVAALALRRDLKKAMTWIIGLLGLLIVVTWLK